MGHAAILDSLAADKKKAADRRKQHDLDQRDKLRQREEKVKADRAAAEKRGHDVPRHAAQLETQPLPAPEQQKPALQQQQQQQQQQQ